MVRAASLLYAIFISLLVSVLCAGITLLFSLNLNLEDYFEIRKRLLDHNKSGIAYAMANYRSMDKEEDLILFPEEKHIRTLVKTKPWGLFSMLTITTISKTDSIEKKLLIADKRNEKRPALYLRDNDATLKISGKTIIKGDIYISSHGLEKKKISGNAGVHTPEHKGAVFTSEKQMPTSNFNALEYPDDYDLILLDEISSTAFIGDFTKKTTVIQAENILEDITLKGNIIIRSMDTLSIRASAQLTDIIIDAPKVIFEPDFSGNVQVFASHEIIVSSGASLEYPSALIIPSNGNHKKKIVCKKQSTVSGVVLLFGNGLLTESENSVLLQPETTIVGDIFCDGVLSLNGTVIGSVYTSSLLHKTETTQYDNLLFNGIIESQDLPEAFFQVPFTSSFKSQEQTIIKSI